MARVLIGGSSQQEANQEASLIGGKCLFQQSYGFFIYNATASKSALLLLKKKVQVTSQKPVTPLDSKGSSFSQATSLRPSFLGITGCPSFLEGSPLYSERVPHSTREMSISFCSCLDSRSHVRELGLQHVQRLQGEFCHFLPSPYLL